MKGFSMFRTLTQTHHWAWTQRVALIALFVGLTALSAQLKFYLNSPVPYTLQVFVVLLSGMLLGARDGAITQIAYTLLIAFGAPIAANASGGLSYLTGATAGYILGFIPAAFVAGYLVEHGAARLWQRLIAGLVGVVIIYLCGLTVLKFVLSVSWSQAWAFSVAPFIVFDIVKAIAAAGFTESGRRLIQRYF
jgi:biotin transport system substrate-specific component